MGRFTLLAKHHDMLTVIRKEEKVRALPDDHHGDADDECEVSVLYDSERGFSCPTAGRVVAFGSVEVREYACTMGDHPCCRSGCPVTLDWEYEVQSKLSVDKYELQRAPLRKSREKLLSSWEERMEKIDSSEGEVRRCARKLHRERSCNRKVLKRQQQSFFEEGETV